MKSRTTATFRKLLAELPREVRAQAIAAYRLFMSDPRHTSLHFKRLNTPEPLFSVRVGKHYRAVGVQREP